MIARYGASLGRILRGKAGAYNVALVKTIPDESCLKKDFLFYWLSSSYFQGHLTKIGNRAAQAGFNKEGLAGIGIILPPISLQNELSERVAGIRTLEDEQAAGRRRLDDLFESMLQRAFSGEL